MNAVLPHEIATPGSAAGFAESLAAQIPVLETPRLTIRAPRLSDFPILVGIINSPRGSGVGGPKDREGVWVDFVQMTATWLLHGHGWWTITRKDDGDPLGFVGIGFEPGDEEPELGYMLDAAAEGQGIAYEAATAARAHGFGPCGLKTMISYIYHKNTRSIALARRLGAELDTTASQDKPGVLVYRHNRGLA